MITIKFCQDGKKSIEIDAESVADAVKKAIESGADLGEADLRGANLSEANLSEANLRGADLSEADLCEANLCGADLGGADLREANLRGADLCGANLRGANLRGADLDFSCWPLWCGSLRAKIDKKIFCQILYHVVRAGQSVDDPEVLEVLKNQAIIDLANQFHRADECGKIINARGE